MKIKSIRKVAPRTVFALTTSTGTFIANGLAHHNCVACNVFLHGNIYPYSLALKRKYGPNILEELDAKRKEVKKYTRSEYETLIEKYK